MSLATTTQTLGCFQCSELQISVVACPDSKADTTTWQSDPSKYSEVNTSPDTPFYCSVIVGKSGRIYHQGSLTTAQCEDQNYIERLARNIAKKYQDPESQIKCCSISGCNWGWTSASANLGPRTLSSNLTTGSSDNTVIIGLIGAGLLGLLIVILCLLICWLLFTRKKRQESQEDAPNTTKFQPSRYAQIDRVSNKNSMGGHLPASRSRNTGIQYEDAEADMYNYDFKDKWDASQLNTADQWNVGRYRKDTVGNNGRDMKTKIRNDGVKLNNYFSYGDKGDLARADTKYNDNKVPKQSTVSTQSQGNTRPEWKDVYRSESVAPPEDGSVNPFSYA